MFAIAAPAVDNRSEKKPVDPPPGLSNEIAGFRRGLTSISARGNRKIAVLPDGGDKSCLMSASSATQPSLLLPRSSVDRAIVVPVVPTT